MIKMAELADIAVIFSIYLVIGSVLFVWISRSKSESQPVNRSTDKIRQHITMLLWMLVLVLFVYIGGGFLAHQDASWHQVRQPSETIMPARIIIYLILYPSYLMIGGAAWLHARAYFGEGIFNRNLKIALFLATFVPFVFLPAQDPDAMRFDVDLANTFFRAGYGLMMFIWLAAVGYIITQQGLAILKLFRESEL